MGRPYSTIKVKPCATPGCTDRVPESDRICLGCLIRFRRAARERGDIRPYVPPNGLYGPEYRRGGYYYPDDSDGIRRLGFLSRTIHCQRTYKVVV